MNSSWKKAAAGIVLAAAFAVYTHSAAAAITVTRQVTPSGGYTPGGPLLVSVTVNSDTPLSVIGLEERLPNGWLYEGYISGEEPKTEPFAEGNNGVWEFSWFLPTPQHFSFSYQVRPPASHFGTKEISGQAIGRFNEQEMLSPIHITRVDRIGSGTPHDADRNTDFILSLSELLRQVQFFAMGGYRCIPDNLDPQEDGLFAGTRAGDFSCAPIDTDFEGEGDYFISLTELLRVVQLYNAGTYHSCDNDEDGFCAGPPN